MPTVRTKLIPLCPQDVTTFKIQNNGRTLSFYFTNADDVNSLIDRVDANDFLITEVQHPESEDHLELMHQDHKIVFRSKFFYDFFEWRIVFKRLDREEKRELADWVKGFFDTSAELGERYSFTEGVNPILYLRDEDDVMMAKLTQSSRVRKVEKAVLLSENNNNNTGSNETRTLPQTS
jgi:hypothetical protein